MRNLSRSLRILISVLLGTTLATTTARADIIGFGNFSSFTVNEQSGPPQPQAVESSANGGTIDLVGGAGAQFADIWSNTPQNVSHFNTSFTFRGVLVSGAVVSELVFQNNPNGAHAITGIVSQSDTSQKNVAALQISASPFLGVNPASGPLQLLFPTTHVTNGGGVNTESGDPINVAVGYNGSSLQVTLTDMITSGTDVDSYAGINLSAIVGGSTSYAGFAASSGQNSNQFFSNFQFASTAAPEPSSVVLLGAGGLGLLAYLRRRRRA